MSSPIVLITGGTGYVGSFSIIEALRKGYTVRTTIRSLKKADTLKANLLKTAPELTKETLDTKLSFYEADLTKDAGWEEAVKGSQFVLHIASPFLLEEPKDENELIVPAREGALRVLRASHKLGGVEKIVLTSSFAAIGYGHQNHSIVDETTWTDVSKVKGAYIKSKAIAEKAAWDFVKENNTKFKLTTINPVGISGPTVAGSPGDSSSIEIIQKMISGEMKMGAPSLYMGYVDVRDVAQLHVAALSNSSTDGERFLLTAGPEISVLDLAQLVRVALKGNAKSGNLPTRFLPSWLVRFVGKFVSSIGAVVPYLDSQSVYSSEKAQKYFKWTPISLQDSITATVKSLEAEGKI